MNHQRPEVLLVEDNPNDEALTCRALRTSTRRIDVTVVRDGAEALDYIFAVGQFEDRDVMVQPNVVLLDLNLPKISGLDVLKAIRADERTRLLPVVIMTSSREDVDLIDGYQNGANSYVVKPVKFEEFAERVQQLGVYWISTNESPNTRTT
ncbi:response regulator [Kineosporia sp. NBRC 101731]|uniref:response regulator n=1 Tax=Kineosporia sp. NBRC 101731 TaxID=3032199 RepID=UPI0024A3791A|nr:response regulator [Kineosporia sp. NBRC 101731]GLY29350.1 two-component system response regulator [Kineosporia sp. NBRC 101731]